MADLGITVAPFRADDARAIPLHPDVAAAWAGCDLDTVWAQYEAGGPAFTLRVDEGVIGCAGLLFPWPHTRRVAHAWLLPSPRLAAYRLTGVKALVSHLQDLIDQHQVIRVGFEVRADFALGHRFAQWLGFTREQDGLARRYGPADQDFVRYEMVAPR